MFEENGKPVFLWPSVPPMSHGTEPQIDLPTITPYFPPVWKACRKAIIILPGGAYRGLAEHEGKGYADYFASQGYHCFVVKYRLGSNHYHHPAELSDAARAVRMIRAAAPELGIRQDCIGIMGSSAGAHLAASLGNLFEKALIAPDEGETGKVSSRPDWMVLCYPVITSRKEYVNAPSFANLEGPSPDPEEHKLLSLENSVAKQTPPAFIWHTMEDNSVPCENSLLYATALRQNGVPFELHIYQKGCHGRGLFQEHPWAEECVRWMNTF